jgi:hypothetical protein
MFGRNFLLGLIALFCPSVVQSQNSVHEIQPENCEYNIYQLEIANHEAGKDRLLTIMARLGDGERQRNLNWRRLENARTYLTEYIKVRDPKKIVLAEGERVSGFGRIELYIEGKLFSVIAVRRNGDLIVGYCEPEEIEDVRHRRLRKKLYPWRDRNK